ncbi:MAG: hypothetical protein ACTH2U_15375 [Brevibacterium sp.]
MTPMRRPTSMPRMLTALAGTALALSLTGCGLLGGGNESDPAESDAAQTEDAQSGEAAESGESEGQMGQAAETEEPTEAAEPEPSETESEDPFADAATTTNWASDDAMEVDKKGNGTVPARSLEADLVDLFENKLDFEVKKAECAKDMELREWYGFETCNVTVKDDSMTKKEKTYYGTVKIVDHKDKMIKYELMFPGIDKEDFDFKD